MFSAADVVPTFVTVVSMETRWTFADVGFNLASTGCSVLTRRREAVIHRYGQEVARTLASILTLGQDGDDVFS